MIELSSTEGTTIGFKINIEGNSETPKARFFLVVSDDFSLMFPARVFEDKAIVNIPALSFISSFKETELSASFEVLVNGSYFIPWQGMAVLKTPVKVDADLERNEIETIPDAEVEAEIDATIKYEDVEKSKKSKSNSLKEELGEEESFAEFIRKRGMK